MIRSLLFAMIFPASFLQERRSPSNKHNNRSKYYSSLSGSLGRTLRSALGPPNAVCSFLFMMSEGVVGCVVIEDRHVLAKQKIFPHVGCSCFHSRSGDCFLTMFWLSISLSVVFLVVGVSCHFVWFLRRLFSSADLLFERQPCLRLIPLEFFL